MSVFLIPIISVVAVFTFLSIAVWAGTRTREREAFYKSEERRRMIEAGGAGAESVVELTREEERIAQRRRVEGIKLGGLITAAVGGGWVFAFRFVDPEAQFLGVIPLFVGIAMLLYVFLMAPKPPKADAVQP
jgi:hypothetical protein